MSPAVYFCNVLIIPEYLSAAESHFMLVRSACLFGFIGLLLVGCSGEAPPEVVPALEKVTGKVTLDGKPAVGVAVTFSPATGVNGNGASAITDSSGAYTLNYRTGDAGIPQGEYVALFSKLTKPDGSPIPEGQTAADVMAVDQIPERYRSLESREMGVMVPAGGVTKDFDLKSK